MSSKYRNFLKSKTCAWCGKVYEGPNPSREVPLDKNHLATCPVRKEVAAAEARAGRVLTFDGVRAVRDRARGNA